MSIASAQALVNRIKSDHSFADVFAKASPSERASILASNNWSFTPEELNSITVELGEDQLDNITGGVYGLTNATNNCGFLW